MVYPARNQFFVASLKVTIMTGHLKGSLFVMTALQGGLGEAVRRPGPVWAEISPKILFFTLHLYNPPFWSQSDPTQCNHNIPISEDYSGYLYFSVRCQFGCLSVCCMASIAKNYQTFHFIAWMVLHMSHSQMLGKFEYGLPAKF